MGSAGATCSHPQRGAPRWEFVMGLLTPEMMLEKILVLYQEAIPVKEGP